MGAPLAAVLAARVVAAGPLPFDEYMRACLYDPEHGYFATGALRSTATGDFLTSPEVSPWFGRTIARFAASAGEGPLTVVEVGAGSGSLLRPLLAAIDGRDVVAHAVEVSPAAREALQALPGVGVHRSLDEVPLEETTTVVVVANELLDNLPAALAVRAGGGWRERHVDLVGGELATVDLAARPEVVAWADRFAGPVPVGGIVEVQLEAGRWISDVLGRIPSGALVVFDYGDTADGLAPRRAEGTVRTYRGHHLGPDPLLEPGATDITMDVNFTAMVAAAEEAGAEPELLTQAAFLERWGLRDEIDRLAAEEHRLAADGDPMHRLRVRSERTDVTTLLHPRGLGDFRTLTATKRQVG